MRHTQPMLPFIAAVLVVFTPVTAIHATEHAADDPAADSESHDVAVTIVNNTTTPPAGKDKPGGLLNINCGAGVQRVEKDTTRAITCTVADGESLDLSYNDGTRTSTATVDCGEAAGPDFTDESEVTLTFTGSGTSITFTQSCTGLG